jgi:RNA polymerase sigma-32 factor
LSKGKKSKDPAPPGAAPESPQNDDPQDRQDRLDDEIDLIEAEVVSDEADSVVVPASDEPKTDVVEVVGEHGSAVALRDSLSAYLSDIRRYPVLSREEEHELAVAFHEEGDREAAYKLVTANLRLVVMIAREYQRAFHNLLDLVQEGNVGLLEAVKQFDPYRGVRFPSYAVWWVRAYVIRHVMNNFRLVKVGTTQAQRRLFFNLQKEKARLEAKGFTPTPEMIAENLGVKPKEVIEMDLRMGAGAEVSADAPVAGGEGDSKVLDLLPTETKSVEDSVADFEFFSLMTEKLGEFRQTLEGRNLEIIDERLLAEDPITLQELGDRWGVSRERVRQIEEALKNKLKEFLVEVVRDDDAVELD